MEPLPPVKEVEYRCFISKIFEELSGSEYMTFAFETAKEFSSFRYEIAVRYRIQPGLLEFRVLGMTATRTMMPSFGTARSVLKVPLLPLGVYAVKMVKSDGTENMFSIEVTKRGFQLLQPIPRKRFIDIVIENKAAAPGARNLSTVSKTPPVPLVPRTIQKRQQPPTTPEELAIAAMLTSETHEEREAREDSELFDGNDNGNENGNGNGHKRKSSAKNAIDEIEEVPANADTEIAKAKPEKTAKAEKAPKPEKTAKPAQTPKPKPEPKPKKSSEKKADSKAKPPKKPAQKTAPVKQQTPAKKAAPAKAKSKPKAKAEAKKSAPKNAGKKAGKKK